MAQMQREFDAAEGFAPGSDGEMSIGNSVENPMEDTTGSEVGGRVGGWVGG